MNYLLFCLFLSVLECVYSQSISDNRVIGFKGEKLPLYTDLYYGVRNKLTGNYICEHFHTFATLDTRNASVWMKIIWDYSYNNYAKMVSGELGAHNNYDRIDDNYYRILVAPIQGVNNGKPLADLSHVVSTCSDGCDNEFSDIFQWSFTLHPDYKLNAIMTDFQYETPLKQIIDQHIKKVDLLQTSVLTNDSPAKITEEVTIEVKKTQTFQVSYSKSIETSSKYFAKYSAHAEVKAEMFGIGVSAGVTTEFGVELGSDSTTTSGNSKSVSKEITYSIKKTVEVPPYEKVQVLSYVNWIDNLSMPYKAKVTVTGIAPSFESTSNLDTDSILALLSKYGFNETLIGSTATSLTFEVRGTIIGSFGLDSVFSVTSLGKTRNTTTYYSVVKSQSTDKTGDGYVISY